DAARVPAGGLPQERPPAPGDRSGQGVRGSQGRGAPAPSAQVRRGEAAPDRGQGGLRQNSARTRASMAASSRASAGAARRAAPSESRSAASSGRGKSTRWLILSSAKARPRRASTLRKGSG